MPHPAPARTVTKAALLKRLEGLDREERKRVVCALIGHSLITTTCFGYYNCGRCGEQIGDSLGSIFPAAAETVVIGHNCKTCRTNYAKLTWEAKYLAPNPFKREATTHRGRG